MLDVSLQFVFELSALSDVRWKMTTSWKLKGTVSPAKCNIYFFQNMKKEVRIAYLVSLVLKSQKTNS